MATTAGRPHPLFTRSAEDRRYAGALGELLPALRSEAFERQGRWAWRVLPRGAVVSMRIRGDMDMRKEVRISRGERPETPEAEKRWAAEIDVFREQLGLEDWQQLPPDPADDQKGGVAVRFIELRKGEVSPGKARCHRCHLAGVAKLIEWKPGAGVTGQHCTPHAFEAGREHTEEVRQRLGLG